jgi:hypothetical protein
MIMMDAARIARWSKGGLAPLFLYLEVFANLTVVTEYKWIKNNAMMEI